MLFLLSLGLKKKKGHRVKEEKYAESRNPLTQPEKISIKDTGHLVIHTHTHTHSKQCHNTMNCDFSLSRSTLKNA